MSNCLISLFKHKIIVPVSKQNWAFNMMLFPPLLVTFCFVSPCFWTRDFTSHMFLCHLCYELLSRCYTTYALMQYRIILMHSYAFYCSYCLLPMASFCFHMQSFLRFYGLILRI